MFFFNCRAELDQALYENKCLKEKVERLENRIIQINKDLADAEKADVASSTFTIDFNKMDVFSIERHIKGDKAVTIVGHFLQEPVKVNNDVFTLNKITREWNLSCSQEQHERLVKDFAEFKKKQK